MNTVEKRAELEARGEPWPGCECHGKPLLWHGDSRYIQDGYFHCRVTAAEQQRQRVRQRRAAGCCADCGNPADGYYCPSCQTRHADREYARLSQPGLEGFLRRGRKQLYDRAYQARRRRKQNT